MSATAGVITEYPLPSANSRPSGITSGPDGNLWFTEYRAGQIGFINAKLSWSQKTGQVSE